MSLLILSLPSQHVYVIYDTLLYIYIYVIYHISCSLCVCMCPPPPTPRMCFISGFVSLVPGSGKMYPLHTLYISSLRTEAPFMVVPGLSHASVHH